MFVSGYVYAFCRKHVNAHLKSEVLLYCVYVNRGKMTWRIVLMHPVLVLCSSNQMPCRMPLSRPCLTAAPSPRICFIHYSTLSAESPPSSQACKRRLIARNIWYLFVYKRAELVVTWCCFTVISNPCLCTVCSRRTLWSSRTAMSASEPPAFLSVEEERDYWKERAAQHRQRCCGETLILCFLSAFGIVTASRLSSSNALTRYVSLRRSVSSLCSKFKPRESRENNRVVFQMFQIRKT